MRIGTFRNDRTIGKLGLSEFIHGTAFAHQALFRSWGEYSLLSAG